MLKMPIRERAFVQQIYRINSYYDRETAKKYWEEGQDGLGSATESPISVDEKSLRYLKRKINSTIWDSVEQKKGGRQFVKK